MSEFKHKQQKNATIYVTTIVAFFVLNIFNTYFITTNVLNKHMVTFNRSALGEFNSFVGNFIVVFLIYVFVTAITKQARKQILGLVIATFLLNLGVFALYIFTKYYGTTFSIHDLTLFNNPSAVLVGSIFIESIKDLFVYFRIVMFLPFFIIITFYFLFDKRVNLIRVGFPSSMRQTVLSLLIAVPLVVGNLGVFNRLSDDWDTNVARNTYAAQNIGLYSFYMYEFGGGSFKLSYDLTDDDVIDDIIGDYDLYNKNKDQYFNFIDNGIYSNQLKFKDSQNLNLLNGLSLDNDENLNGLFKDKDVVLIHLESYTHFLQELDYLKEFTPFINALLEESYVLDNFYANVGVGTSADAELSVLAGIYPTGDTTLYWDYNEKPFDLINIPKLFKEEGYYTEALHADTPIFYNRGIIYDELYHFDKYYHIDDFDASDYLNELYDHETVWYSDYVLIDALLDQFNQAKLTNDKLFFYPMTMMPHIPFQFLPAEYENNLELLNVLPEDLSAETRKYLAFLPYYDTYMKHLFYDIKTGEQRYLDDTVYIFYSDHGVKVEKKDFELLYNRDFTNLETRHLNSKTIAFIYYPNQEGVEKTYNGVTIREGLIKGRQSLVRNQIDLFRTIIELFDLPYNNNPYFGVNVFSQEPTYAIDNRSFDIYYDLYNEENGKYYTQGYSLIENDVMIKYDQPREEILQLVRRHKHLNDIFIKNNLYTTWYMKIKEAVDN